jgi:hypothetical protein
MFFGPLLLYRVLYDQQVRFLEDPRLFGIWKVESELNLIHRCMG